MQCPHCGSELEKIYVCYHNSGSGYGVSYAFFFTREIPKFKTFSCTVKNKEGDIKTFLCPKCRQVLWFAEESLSS